jgi:hypothetical protein
MHGDWTLSRSDTRNRRRPRQGEANARLRALGFSRAHLLVALLAGLR